jgi:hypothetical protein
MRLYTYEQDGKARVGGEKNGSLVDLSGEPSSRTTTRRWAIISIRSRPWAPAS